MVKTLLDNGYRVNQIQELTSKPYELQVDEDREIRITEPVELPF